MKFHPKFPVALILSLLVFALSGSISARSEETAASAFSKAKALGIIWGQCMQKNFGEQSKTFRNEDVAWTKALKLCKSKELALRTFFLKAGLTPEQAARGVKLMIDGTSKYRAEGLEAYKRNYK